MNRLLLLLLGMLVGLPLVLTGAVPTGLPARPAPLKAVAGSASQIRLSWPARFTNAGEFKIERSTDAEHFVQIAFIPATTNRYADEGLLSSTTYFYRVCHQADGADSPFSNVAHAQTRGPKSHLSLTAWGRTVGDPPAKLDDLIAVAAGARHQLALRKNGKVVVWGDEYATNGDVKFPANLNHVTTIAAGSYHSLALKSDGVVVAWGTDSHGQCTPPARLKNVVAIAAGENHSLALKRDGTVIGWGDNTYGQCTPPANLDHVVAIATASDHSVALKSDGTVVAWGQMLFRWSRPNFTNIVAIAAGSYHDLLLKRDGTVEAWIPFYGYWYENLPPFGLSNVVAIAAGENRNLALKADGTVVGWGVNQFAVTSVPEGLSQVAFIAAKTNSFLALSALPAPPLHLVVRATTTNQATLTWVDNCADEDSYVVERAPSDYWVPGAWSRIATLQANTTRFLDATVQPGNIYWYRVRAHNRRGDSAADPAQAQMLVMLPPIIPYGAYATIGFSNRVNLNWTAYHWVGAGFPDGYEVQRATDVNGTPGLWSTLATLDGSNRTSVAFADTQVEAWQSYWYRIRSTNVFGVSDYAGPVPITLSPPAEPSPLNANPFANRINLTCFSGDAFSSGIDCFQLEKAPDLAGLPGVWTPLVTIPVKNSRQWSYAYSDSNLTLNATWWYRVRSHNWIGYSSYSTPVSATVILPGTPAWLNGWMGASNQVNLSWYQSPNDQNGFRIERAPDAGGTPGIWSEIGVQHQTNSPDGFFTDKAVTALTTNWYRVRAFNQLGNSDYSSVIAVATLPPPQPALTIGTYRDQFTLNYGLSDYHFDTGNFDGYKIERALDIGGSPGSWTQIAQTTDEAFTDSGYALNATRWYRVRASNWVGDSVYSPAVSSTIIPSGTPESLVARIGTTNQINLSWSDRYYDHDGFRLERAPDVGGMPGSWTEIAVLPATNSYDGSFTDTNVTALTTNWYRVRAFNGVGLSAYVAPINVAVISPPAPIYSEASVNRDQVDFHWSGDYYAYGEVAGYKVERAPDVGGNPGDWLAISQTLFAENHFIDSGRPGNTTWWYRARAFNWIGTSEPSPIVGAIVRPPATPEPINGKIGVSNQIDLTWSQPLNHLDEDGFRLERAPDMSGAPGIWSEIAVIFATNSYSGFYSDTNVTTLSTNWYRVRAFNVVGSSDFSPPTAMALVPPPPPSSLSAAPNRDQVNLSWYVYFYDYGYVDGFQIERAPDLGGSPGEWSQIGTLTVTNTPAGIYSFTDWDRAVNTTWWYRVHAFNWTGEGDFSPLASASIVAPSSPERLSGQVGNTNQVSLSWYQSKADADGFRVERASDDGGVPGVWTEIGVIPSTNTYFTEFTDTNVTAFTTNWYRVCAVNLFGNSAYVEAIQVAVVPPSAPYYPHAQAYRDGIGFSWYSDNDGSINGFKIERAPDANGEPGTWTQVNQVDANSFGYNDSNLVLNTTWWYRVRAYNWVGDGEPSQETSATVVTPAAPDWLNGRIGSTNQVNLSWYDPAADQDGFQIERAPDVAGVPGTWTEIGVIPATNVYSADFTDTNVTALTTNWYRVRAFNSLGGGDYRVSAAVSIIPPPAPAAYASVYRDQVNLSWYFSYTYYYGWVDGFQIERAPDVIGTPGAWTQIGIVSVDSPNDSGFYYTDLARPADTTFWYRLRAFNWVGEGEYTPAVSATTVPPATPNYIYGALGSTNQINLTWYDFAQDEDGFQLERAPDTNGIPGAWEEIAVISATNSYYANYTDTNVTAYSTNWYRVRAYSKMGASGYCAAIRIQAVPPAAPSLFKTLYYGPANLYWSPNDPAQGSELERATNPAAGPEAWTSVRRYDILCAGYYDDTNIVAGGSYAYRAKAFNWVGDSPWSPMVVLNIPALTPSLAGISASVSTPALRITSLILTNQSVLISWDTLGGTTNVVEATADLADGFADISGPLTITGSGIVPTNYLDSGALTNANRRFYRIKVP
jgi:hypothetical protein